MLSGKLKVRQLAQLNLGLIWAYNKRWDFFLIPQHVLGSDWDFDVCKCCHQWNTGRRIHIGDADTIRQRTWSCSWYDCFACDYFRTERLLVFGKSKLGTSGLLANINYSTYCFVIFSSPLNEYNYWISLSFCVGLQCHRQSQLLLHIGNQ